MRDPYEKYHENSIIKHVEQIQRKSERGQTNSFLIKGFALTSLLIFFTSYFRLDSSIQGRFIPLLVLIPFFMFWYLDARNFKESKEYDEVYKRLSGQGEDNIIMDIKNMNPRFILKEKPRKRYIDFLEKAFFSQEVSLFYSSMGIIFSIIFFSQNWIYISLLVLFSSELLFILLMMIWGPKENKN